MAQQIILVAQLVPKFQGIKICNNYDVLQSIPCSPEYKVVGQILLDHPLSYALTATADVPAEITYIVDMFRDTFKLPVETQGNPFITPVTIRTIESFMQAAGYQGVVDKYSIIPQRHDEDYHSIKDDILLLLKHKKMLLKYNTSWRRRRLIRWLEDEESYTSEFPDSMLNDDDDDSGTRIEPGSHKENPKVIADDDVTKRKDDEKDEDEVKDDDVEKTDNVVKEKDNVEYTNHTLVKTHATGSMETRNEQMQTPIPTPTRSSRNELSSNKKISEELTAPVSPTTATTSKTKTKRGFTSNKTKILLGSIVGMCRRPIRRIQDFNESKDHCLTLKNTPRYGVSVPALHKKPRRIEVAVSRRSQYAAKSPGWLSISANKLNTTYLSFLTNTAYLIQQTDTAYSGHINHRKLIEEAMTGVMTELILRECVEKVQAESSLAKPKIDNNVKIELNNEHLKGLRNNAYNGSEEEDLVDHNAKVLEILDSIKTPNMDTNRLRAHVFLSRLPVLQEIGG
ncbi:hypothetical protein Tco_0020531 [Tanacetum coccineum]